MSEWRERTETVPEWKPEKQLLTAFEADDKGFYKSEGSLEMRIDRFAEYIRDGEWRWSAPTYIRGLPWKIFSYSRVNSSDQSNNHNGQSPSKDFGIFLNCTNDSDNQTWDCQAMYTVCVKAQKEGVKDIINPYTDHTFNDKDKDSGWGYDDVVACDYLLDPENGFIKDDKVIVQAHVRVKAVSGIHAIDNGQLFSLATKYPWDFVLVVQDKEVNVQKSHLAMHSEYFKEQFTRHKSDNRATLQDVDYNEFVELLSVIYPTSCPITVENVETISKLAFKFDMADLLIQCEAFLLKHNEEFGRAKSLLMAEWYGLVHLPGKIIDEIENVADVKGMKPNYDALSFRMKRMIFDKICSPGSVFNPISDPEATGISIDRATEIQQKLISSACCESDGVLIVENKQISIHKMYLAVYSEYFKAMFQGKFVEGNKDTIVLEEVSYSEILELLAVMYPTLSPITDTNVGAILKMADRFIMPSILERCKELLQNSTQIRAARKLWFAQRYNLPDLQTEYALKYKTISAVDKLKAEPEFVWFDDKTRALILDSIIS